MSGLATGDHVLVGKVKEKGIVRFIGETQFQAGEWVGIELENPSGKNDGSVLGVRYFECPAARGIFVRPSAVTKVEASPPPAPPSPTSPAPPASPSGASAAAPAVKAKAKAKAKVEAPEPAAAAPMLPARAVAQVQPPADVTDSSEAFRLSQRVCLFNQEGIVRFVGATRFADGIWIGIEFDEPVGMCDGTVQGFSYFQCNANHGVFLQAPNVDPENVRASARKDNGDFRSVSGRRASIAPSPKHGARRTSLSVSRRPSLYSLSASSPEEIVVSDAGNITIVDADGRPMDINDVIQAFEDTQEELEGVQELLEEAHERERDLRTELQRLREMAESRQEAGGSTVAALPMQIAAPVAAVTGGLDVLDNIIMLTESGKVTQHLQYPPDTQILYSYFECRDGKFQEICFFGLQYVLKKYLVGQVVTADKINMAEAFFRSHFSRSIWGYDEKLFNRPGWEYILKQHEGRLPIVIKSVPEGTVTPCRNVLFTVENTDPKCFWLTSYLESLLGQVWYPTTVCTHSREQKKMIVKYLRATGCDEVVDTGLHKFKLHDFGFRGVSSVETSAIAGVAHLVNFASTDTLPALVVAKDYYLDDCAGTSHPVSERSTIASWGQDKELETMRNLLSLHPTGVIACVSDVNSYSSACSNFWGGELLSAVQSRSGCVVVRPESGASFPNTILEILDALERKFGSTPTGTGHKVLPACIRVLQGDGLELFQLDSLLQTMMDKGWAADNLIFGIGGTQLQMIDRETARCALACTYALVAGQDVNMGAPGSALPNGGEPKAGRLTLELDNGKWTTVTNGLGNTARDRLVEVFRDGRLIIDDALASVRRRADGEAVAPILAGTGQPLRPAGQRGRAPAARPPPGRRPGGAAFQPQGDSLTKKAAEIKALSASLKRKAETLKHFVAQRAGGEVDAQEFQWVASIFADCKGDLEVLAQACGLDIEALRKQPPTNGEDFAKKLLDGMYTGDTTEAGRSELRDRLKGMREQLKERRGSLKRTTTKEMNGSASQQEIDLVAVLYTRNNGDFQKIAEQCGISFELLQKRAPKNEKEFARSLLAGEYTQDKSEAAKAELRSRLGTELKKQASMLRRTATKELTGDAMPEDIERVAKLYEDNGGDLDRLARLIGASISLLRRSPPTDARDFAKKLLEGVYTGDVGAMAKAELRERLREDLSSQAGRLKRTATKEYGGPTPVEIAACARLYTSYGGDLAKLAQVCGISLDLLHKIPPKDAADFAQRLLRGSYTSDVTEAAKANLRERLADQLLARKNTLRRTETQFGGQLSAVELQFVGKIYTENGGDLAKIAAACGISLDMLTAKPPTDAQDFAQKLYDGFYSPEHTEMARKQMRDRLRADLLGQITRLKPAVCKEANKTMSRAEVEKIAKIYAQHGGNLEKMAEIFQLTLAMLQKSPPQSGDEFAAKMLDGCYTGDTNEIAKATLRSRLQDDLQQMAANLKAAPVKEKVTGPASSDIEKFAEVYTSLKGDIERLAQMFGLDAGMIRCKMPTSAEDFARRLLDGDFTGETTELAKTFLRKRLRADLMAQAGNLKRSTTKENMVEPVAQDIELLGRVYTQNGGDLARIAEMCGIDVAVLEKSAPTDALDFARKLFNGTYTSDKSESAKAQLRSRLEGELRKQASMLRRTNTKELNGDAQAEDIAAVARIYGECGGDLERISTRCGAAANLVLLQKSPPRDAQDFAKKLLEGVYAGDRTDIAKQQLRDQLRQGLTKQASLLKRTSTKEFTGPSEADVEAASAIYTRHDGDLQAIAQACRLTFALLEKAPPADAKDFGRKLLEGVYTSDQTEEAKAQLRARLQGELVETAGKLRRTATKENVTEASAEEIEVVAKLYASNGGDIDKLAKLCGASPELIRKAPPADGADFARKLFNGSYTTDHSDAAKAGLRDRFRFEIQRQLSQLKRTQTKEAVGEASAEDITLLAGFYTNSGGDLEKIAVACGISLELLQRCPPASAEAFARSLLAGMYTADAAEFSKAQLRERLQMELQATAGKLRRTDTKEACGSATAEDIEALSLIYIDYKGDLERLADVCGVPLALLQKRPPEDGKDFAKNLLEGVYSGEVMTAEGKVQLRDRLREELMNAAAAGKLRRTTTKENITEATAEEIAAVAKLYDKSGGNLEVIAQTGGISLELLRASPPTDGPDFARKLFKGVYTVEIGEAAKAALRNRLQVELSRQRTNLKRIDTIEFSGDACHEDVAVVAKVYEKHGGDIEKLASMYGFSVQLVNRSPPTDAEDFAKKLLEGAYTSEGTEMAKSIFREQLRSAIHRQTSQLKRTLTREASGIASEEDLTAFAALFDKQNGDVQAIAQRFGLSAALLEQRPPADGRDFARKLLAGEYSSDMAEEAKAQLRTRLRGELKSVKSQLKRTTTKEACGDASPEDMEAIAAIYDSKRGDWAQLAATCGISMQLLESQPPADGLDFARKLLGGVYSLDSNEHAKAELRRALAEAIKAQKKHLRRTDTKVGTGEANEEDVRALSTLFDKREGNLEALAKVCGVSLALLEERPPADGAEFARRLLAGEYTPDATESAKKELRDSLRQALVAEAANLKRQTTRELMTEPPVEDLELLGRVYTANGGDLAKIAKICQLEVDLLERDPPADAVDFARKLCSGTYTVERDEAAKAELRGRLKQELERQTSLLRRTTTKELSGAAMDEDITSVAKVYIKCGGDLDRLAGMFHLSIALLRKSPPADARDFAKKLLEGAYSGEGTALAKQQLRERLRDDLQRQASMLRRTVTKEASGPSEDDLEAAAKIYNEHNGDKALLAHICGISLTLLQQKPPSGPMDFAAKLLDGAYSADMNEEAKSQLRMRLAGEISVAASSLKRTTTKENMTEATAEELEVIANLYEKNGGDLEKLAKMCGISAEVMTKNPPADAAEFAKKLLNGSYCTLAVETPKAQRERFRADLFRQKTQLRRTETKEATGDATAEDIALLSAIYEKCDGNLDQLAGTCGISLELLHRSPPADAATFARQLLAGTYTADQAEIAKSLLRDRLRAEVTNQLGKLKRAQTKEVGFSVAMEEDIEAICVIYDKLDGDLQRLAEVFGLSAAVLEQRCPKGGKEFAKNLLEGAYSAEGDAPATPERKAQIRVQVRARIQDDMLAASKAGLKRTTTKEGMGEVSADELSAVAALFEKSGGDLNTAAQLSGASLELMHASPPTDAMDFARKLFQGMYTADVSEAAKSALRQRLKIELNRQRTNLKRTVTIEMSGSARSEDIALFAKLYEDLGGDLDKIAMMCGARPDLISRAPPINAHDFGKKLLEGVYTGDSGEMVKQLFREQLRGDLTRQASLLRRTQTKEVSALATSEDDVEAFSVLYGQYGGDLTLLSHNCGISLSLLRERPPVDAKDFARRLLAGDYTTDMAEEAKAQLRARLKNEISVVTAQLKRTQTREVVPQAAAEDIAVVAQLFEKQGGDLEKLAQMCGVSLDMLQAHSPTDGDDFARKLLRGVYCLDTSEFAKAQLRSNLREVLQRQTSLLRRTQTKEATGEASAQDVQAIAAIYSQHGGDLTTLAKACNIPQAVLEEKHPTDAVDFAKRLLAGDYTVDACEMAKRTLRDGLLDSLQNEAGNLKRQTTKESLVEPVTEDLELLGRLYSKHSGDLHKIAEVCGLDIKLLEKSPPADELDFARKLFSGVYTSERSEAAKAELRSRLKMDLQRQASQLRRTRTKEMSGDALAEDIAAVAQFYRQLGGDLDKLAEACRANLLLLRISPPEGAEDFAKKLLEGAYTGEKSDVARALLRERLREELLGQAGRLKRTTTKEMQGPSEADIAAAADLYTAHDGDVDRIASLCGVSKALMEKNAPADANDFARKLLAGAYTSDPTEKAKAQLRARLQGDLTEVAGQLKRTTTKENVTDASPREIEVIAALYNSNGGDAPKLAGLCGISLELLEKSPPTDGEDFARKLFSGIYTRDLTETDKAALTRRFASELQRQLSAGLTSELGKLRRTMTKESPAEASAEDIAAIAALYQRKGGDLLALAELTGTSLDLMRTHAPVDAADFARKLLRGTYTWEGSEAAKASLRQRLGVELNRQRSNLKRVATVEWTGVARAEDIAAVAKFFETHGGDLAQIAAATGADLKLLQRTPPADADDFAKKLLEGMYTGDQNELAKQLLRGALRGELERTSTLKRTQTKEATGVASEEVVEAFAGIFAEHAGDLALIAHHCGISAALLKQRPPADGKDFARKLLAGEYTSDQSEEAKAQLRARLQGDIQVVQGRLRRTQTKECNGEATQEDVEILARLYDKKGGDLAQLAVICCVSLDLLQSHSPVDGTDFGRKLLRGVYSMEGTDVAKAQLRNNLREVLQRQSSQLRRTETRVGTGEASEEDVQALAAVYTAQEGSLEKLSQACGIDLALLQEKPPADAVDFARRLLSGVYSKDAAEAAKKSLRDRLKAGLQDEVTKLRKVEKTIQDESTPALRRALTLGQPSAAELAAVAAAFTHQGGDLMALATLFSASSELIRRNPPANAEEFASRLLAGEYTDETAEVARDRLRRLLRDELKLGSAKLRRTNTKEATGEPAEADIEAMVAIYEEHEGDLEKLASLCGASLQLLRQSPPADARDFSKKFLKGLFSE